MKIHKPQQQTIHDRNENESDTICDNLNEDNDDIMSELINSYEKLMNKHNDALWANLDNHARDSRVVLACEMYTIEELRRVHNHWYEVYSFRVIFSDEGQDQNEDDEAKGVYDGFEVERGRYFDENYADGGKDSQVMQQYSNQASVTHTHTHQKKMPTATIPTKLPPSRSIPHYTIVSTSRRFHLRYEMRNTIKIWCIMGSRRAARQ